MDKNENIYDYTSRLQQRTKPTEIIFQYISNKIQRYTVYLYLETALRVSDGTSTHHQERIQLYLQHLVFVTPLLLPAAIVEELELLEYTYDARTHKR